MLNTILLIYIVTLITTIVTKSKSISNHFYTLLTISLLIFLFNLNYIFNSYLNFTLLNIILIILGSIELIFIVYTLSWVNQCLIILNYFYYFKVTWN